MKKVFIFFLFVISFQASAFNFSTFGFQAEAFMAAIRVTSLIAIDGPLPMTHFEKKQWKASVQPTYVMVDTLYEDDDGQDMEGDGFNGFGGAGAYSYALNDRWELVTMISGVKLDGKMNGSVNNNSGQNGGQNSGQSYLGDGNASMISYNFGLGYDLLKEREVWSIPVYFGIFLGHYNMDFDFVQTNPSNQPSVKAESNGLLYGGFFGIQAARNVGSNFQIAPYFFVSSPINEMEATMTVTDTNNNSAFYLGQIEEGRANAVNLVGLGFNVTYRPWGFTLNLGGILPNPFNESFSHGLKMTKISFSWSWGSEDDGIKVGKIIKDVKKVFKGKEKKK